jgi:lipoate-protein ligase A
MDDSHWRLIHTPDLPGTENMALDHALLENVAEQRSRPVLRLYSWQPFCLSIGYAQPIADVDQEALARRGWDLVRRPTGGRAILHGDELTYSVIGPATNQHLRGGVLESYRCLSQGLVEALKNLGLSPAVAPDSARLNEVQRANPICFEVPSAYEITAGGKKLIGSAQTRRLGAVLQHGTIPLTGDITRVCQVLSYPSEPDRQAASTTLPDRATTLSQVLGRPVGRQEAATAVAAGFSTALGLFIEPDELSAAEIARGHELASTLYSQAHWTKRV